MSDAVVDPNKSTRVALATVYAGYVLRYVYPLLIVPFLGRVLGPEAYGQVLTASSLSQLVWMITEYGFPLAGTRDAASASTRSRVGEIYGEHLAGRLVMILPGLALGIVGTLLSPVLRDQWLFGALATCHGIASAFNMGWFFQGRQRFITSIALEVAGFVLNLTLILALVRGPQDAVYILGINAFTGVILTIAAHVLSVRMLEGAKAQIAGAFRLIRESTALFAHKGLSMMISNSSLYLVGLFAAPQEVGFYGGAERIVGIGLSAMAPASQVLIGTVSLHLNSSETEAKAYVLMRRSLLIMVALGCVMCAGMELLPDLIISIALGAGFAPAVPMLRILAIMYPFTAAAQVISGYVLIPLRLERFVSLASLVGLVSTTALTVVLAGSYDATGVAWARTIGQVLVAITLYVTLKQTGVLPRLRGVSNALG